MVQIVNVRSAIRIFTKRLHSTHGRQAFETSIQKLYLDRLVGIDAEVLEDLADEPEEVGPPVHCPMRSVVLADLERDCERSRAHVELAAVDDAEQLE